MDTGSIMVATTLVVVCVAPFVVLKLTRANKEKKIINALKSKAKESNHTIDEYEIFRDFIVGIDQSHKAFYCEPINEITEEGFRIDLSSMRNCKIEKETRSVGESGNMIQIMEQLAIIFQPIDKLNKPFRLIFYKAEKHLQLSGELQSVKSWEDRINGILS